MGNCRTFQIKGNHNAVKAKVLKTLYDYTVTKGWKGLTAKELYIRADVPFDYVRKCLPVWCGASKYYLTGHRWNKNHLPILRIAAAHNNRAVFLYRLSEYGREFCERYGLV